VVHACNPSYSGNWIKRITVQNQPWQKKFRPHLDREKKKAGHSDTCHPSIKQEDHNPGWPKKKQDPISKISRGKMLKPWLQAAEHQTHKHKALNSNCNTVKKIKKDEKSEFSL
jgi:hypothetical protein